MAICKRCNQPIPTDHVQYIDAIGGDEYHATCAPSPLDADLARRLCVPLTVLDEIPSEKMAVYRNLLALEDQVAEWMCGRGPRPEGIIVCLPVDHPKGRGFGYDKTDAPTGNVCPECGACQHNPGNYPGDTEPS